MGRTIAPGERPLYKGAKITFVTEQTGQKTLYKPRVENYSALLAQYSAAADDLFRRNTAMTELIAQDIRANWGRTTSAKIAEDKIGRDDAYAKSAVFYFSKHGYQPLTRICARQSPCLYTKPGAVMRYF